MLFIMIIGDVVNKIKQIYIGHKNLDTVSITECILFVDDLVECAKNGRVS